jgi:hypothetical protein
MDRPAGIEGAGDPVEDNIFRFLFQPGLEFRFHGVTVTAAVPEKLDHFHLTLWYGGGDWWVDRIPTLTPFGTGQTGDDDKKGYQQAFDQGHIGTLLK